MYYSVELITFFEALEKNHCNNIKQSIAFDGAGEESGSDNLINLVSYTSRSFLTASTSRMSPKPWNALLEI